MLPWEIALLFGEWFFFFWKVDFQGTFFTFWELHFALWRTYIVPLNNLFGTSI
jgi:hypothetical protein